ncbi:hypothetical protein Droror1_Dr00028205 [Drosera rotundifolia]
MDSKGNKELFDYEHKGKNFGRKDRDPNGKGKAVSNECGASNASKGNFVGNENSGEQEHKGINVGLTKERLRFLLRKPKVPGRAFALTRGEADAAPTGV